MRDQNPRNHEWGRCVEQSPEARHIPGRHSSETRNGPCPPQALPPGEEAGEGGSGGLSPGSEAGLRAILGAMTDLVVVLDQQGRILEIAPTGAKQVERMRGDFHGRTLEELFQPSQSAPLRQAIDRALRQQRPIPVDFQYGNGFGCHCFSAVINPMGTDRVLSVIRDVTETEQLKGKVQNALQGREDIFQAVGHPAMIVAPDRTVRAVNRALLEASGRPVEELVGKPCHQVFHDPGCTAGPPPGCPFARAVANGRMETAEMEGEAFGRHYLVSCAPVFNAEGMLLHVVHVATDITDRKRAEDALKASRERLQLALEATGAGICAHAVPPGPDTYLGDRWLAILGLTRDELPAPERFTGWFRKRIYPGDVEAHVSNFEELVAGTRPAYDTQLRMLHQDGHWLLVRLLIRAARRDETGRATRVIGVMTDITEYRQLEDQFRQAQKMEAVGRLAGGVAHDFNNMLSIINGYTELALFNLSESDSLYGDLREIQKAAQRSTNLVRQLLAFARKQTIDPIVLDLNELVEQSRKMLGRLIGEDIQFRFAPQEDLWPVRMDPAQVDQILANLAVNARDAIAGVGSVSVETANVILDQSYCAGHPGATPGEYVRMTFSDSGCGMDRETLARIFEPFFTTKGEGKGTGLGLSTVYGIVKQNNGYIDVASEPGAGTSFRIHLPRAEGETRVASQETEDRSIRGNETILVVEDEEQILGFCKKVLERQGYRVLTADRPGEALLLCEKHQGEIHLLLTDVIMPLLTGQELKERVATMRPGIKVLHMSGYPADVIGRQGVLAEGTRFIQKPLSPSELARRVRRVLDE